MSWAHDPFGESGVPIGVIGAEPQEAQVTLVAGETRADLGSPYRVVGETGTADTGVSTMYVAVDQAPDDVGDVSFEVTYDGLTQTVSPATGDRDAGVAAPLYDEPTIGVEAPCTSEGFATPQVQPDVSCVVNAPQRTPYLPGHGWAEEGRTFVLVTAFFTVDSVEVRGTSSDVGEITPRLTLDGADPLPPDGRYGAPELAAGSRLGHLGLRRARRRRSVTSRSPSTACSTAEARSRWSRPSRSGDGPTETGSANSPACPDSLSTVGEGWNRLLTEISRFAAVGGIATFAAFLVFNFLVHGLYLTSDPWLSGRPVTAFVLANFVGMVISYRLSRYWTFKHRPPQHADGGRTAYFVINTVTMVIPMACLWFSRNTLGLDDPLADNLSGVVIGQLLGQAARFYLFREYVFQAPAEMHLTDFMHWTEEQTTDSSTGGRAQQPGHGAAAD